MVCPEGMGHIFVIYILKYNKKHHSLDSLKNAPEKIIISYFKSDQLTRKKNTNKEMGEIAEILVT